MDFDHNENDSNMQEEAQMSPPNEHPVTPCKEAVRSRKPTKGILKKSQTLEKPVTSKINPKYSKTRLPLSNPKPAPAKLPRPIKTPSSPPNTKPKKITTNLTETVPTTVERNKLKVFNIAMEKLRGMQSDFMERYFKLKDIKGLELKGQYKLVGFVLNESCKLVVSDDDLMRIPKNLPSESISDLKERVRICVDSGLNILYDHLKDIKMCKNEAECRYQIECTRELLAQDQHGKLDALLKQVDLMCKDIKGGADTDLANALRDLQETRRTYKALERKLLDLKKQNAEELFQVDSSHRAALEESKKECDEMEKTLMKQVNELKSQCDMHSDTVGDKDSTIEMKNNEIKALKKQIIELNTSIRELNARLENIEELLIASRASIKNKNDTIISLEAQLHQARVHIYRLQSIPVLEKFNFDEKDHVIIELQMQVTSLKTRNLAFEADIHKYKVSQRGMNDMEFKYNRMKVEIQKIRLLLANKSPNTSNNEMEDIKQQVLKYQQVIASPKRGLSHSVSGEGAGAQSK